MKKAGLLLAISLISIGAGAQQKAPAAKKSGHSHRVPKKEVPQNFAVCKYNSGYYICDQQPGPYNATHPGMTITEEKPYLSPNNYINHRKWRGNVYTPAKPEPVAPESQSYPVNTNTTQSDDDSRYIIVGPFEYSN